MKSGRIMAELNSGITWYMQYGSAPSLVALFPAWSYTTISNLTHVPAGCAGIVASQKAY